MYVWTPLTDKTHKYIMWEDNKCNKLIVNDRMWQYPKEDAHMKEMLRIRSFFLMYYAILMFIKFTKFGTWCFNGLRQLFHSFCCTTWCIF